MKREEPMSSRQELKLKLKLLEHRLHTKTMLLKPNWQQLRLKSKKPKQHMQELNNKQRLIELHKKLLIRLLLKQLPRLKLLERSNFKKRELLEIRLMPKL